MMGVLINGYLGADLWSNTINWITRTNPTTKSTQKQNLNKTTILYNQVGNKSSLREILRGIALGLLFLVILPFFVPPEI